jgi:ABC-2 type transport system ATP-binding protein
MVTQTISCPKCHTQITIQGTPGQRQIVTCPTCGTKGQFMFPTSSTPQPSKGQTCIEVSHLTKKYKDTIAANDITLSVKRGEIFGLLGPNGAGKTTTIKALLGLIRINTGTITIDGHDIYHDGVEAKKHIGYLPERVALFDNLNPIQTLKFFCELRGEDPAQIPGLLKEVGLTDASTRKVGGFSKGMVQLLGIAQVLIGHPSIYILDEPSSGLDPRWTKVIRDKIRYLNDAGATVIFSSHHLSEVESLCDRVAIIDKGRLIAQDSLAKIQSVVQTKPRLEITIPGLQGKTPKILQGLTGIISLIVKGDTITITCEQSLRGKIIALLEEAGYTVSNIKTIEPSLEDAFIKLTGGKAQ